MPYTSDKKTIAGTQFDRRIKLTQRDKDAIVSAHQQGASINGIARDYGVNKRLIQFILFPERQVRNLELREKRGGSAKYYDPKKHKVYIREHRRYKHSLSEKKLI